MRTSIDRIPRTEVTFHPCSYGDPGGRVFWWEGQLYRAISSERAGIYKQLFQDGVIQNLIDKGLLIETEITDLTLDDYGMVLKHRCIPFVSYAYEWSAPMLKDAALLTVDLEIELAQYDLTLQDAHPWNVLFDGCRPAYIDFGSIIPAGNEEWRAYDPFHRFYLYPLQLMASGHARIARWLLHDHEQGVLESDLVGFIPETAAERGTRQAVHRSLSAAKRYVPSPLRPVLRRGSRLLGSALSTPVPETPPSRMQFMRQVRQDVESINAFTLRTEWSDYDQGSEPAIVPSSEWTQKHRSVHQVLTSLKPCSVLDVASNRGWYSQLATLLGSSVVAFDVDEACIGQLYHDAKVNDWPVLPLVMSFTNPSPGIGVCNATLAPATERLKCELVLALAIVHHLVFKQLLNFQMIAEGLSAFSTRWLLVEFVPGEDQHVRQWRPEERPWYTLDNFITALRQQYRSVTVYPSDPEPRVLLLCEK